MKKLIVVLISISIKAIGQDSTLIMNSNDSTFNSVLNEKPKREFIESPFKSPRVIMTHSIEMEKAGVLSFLILHRFGNVNSGASEFFGLDQATIRLGFNYGVSNDFTIGIGRSSYKKEIDEFIKYRIIHQSKGPSSVPISLILVAGNTIQTIKSSDVSHNSDFVNRLSYYFQPIIGRKFNEDISIQIAPTIVHRNLVIKTEDANNTYAFGFGARFRLSRKTSLNVDYYHIFNKDKSSITYDPLSIGFDIETGGHVFQLHITNAIGMNERSFITETTNKWSKGDIQFGFNISRAFQVKKKKL